MTSVTAGSPRVIVPVLSKTTVWILEVLSMASAPLNNTPYSAPLPAPAIMALGVARPTAQGQEMTSTESDSKSENPNTSMSSRLLGERMKLLSGTKKRS